jgi:hypothetical protein
LENPEDEKKPLDVPTPFVIGTVILMGGILLVGVLFGPFYEYASSVAMAIF